MTAADAEARLRSTIRDLAFSEVGNGARGCRLCRRTWPATAEEEHGPGCEAALPVRSLRGGTNEVPRSFLEEAGIAWPSPDPEIGPQRFTKCLEIQIHHPHQTLRYLPPSMPSGLIALEDSDPDDPEAPIATRPMTDAEYAEAMASYERAKDEWSKSGGLKIVKSGPSIVRGRFVLEDGGIASGVFGSGRWVWHEWRSA